MTDWSLLISKLILRPPLLTLFPYTTLFRSLFVDRHHDAAGLGIETVLGAGVAHVPDGLADDARDIDVARDRKSTRLNSSHMSISYAVFCLKKINTASLACTFFCS